MSGTKFWLLERGDFFRFNEEVELISHKLNRGPAWAEEPMCSLQVTEVDRKKDNPTICFECVDNCGTHFVEDLDEEEYTQASNLLGKDLIKTLTFSEVISAAEQVVKNNYLYDVEEETKQIEKLISQ